MAYNYTSVFSHEFKKFLSIRHDQGIKDKNHYIWESLDSHFANIGLNEKAIDADTIESWISLNCKDLTSRSIDGYITAYNAFARYLRDIGFEASVKTFPLNLKCRQYIAYVFTADEITTLIQLADEGKSSRDKLSKLQFPVLLRLLYGCGLRLGEALTLQIRDVDFSDGLLIIKDGKGSKERLVPMHNSLTSVLRQYHVSFLSGKDDESFLFESNYKDGRRNCIGHPRSQSWARHNFDRLLQHAGISISTKKNERGVCPHCLRHTFIDHSLLYQNEKGISSYQALPLISIYVGHESLIETQAYVRLTDAVSETILKKTTDAYGSIFPEVPT